MSKPHNIHCCHLQVYIMDSMVYTQSLRQHWLCLDSKHHILLQTELHWNSFIATSSQS